MAIYRTGTASLSATGVIMGVGTNWQDKLSLVRVGATMIFQTAPLTICTISSIVSATEMRATATDGAVVPAGTKYVILLHDSITVDGLAQDVAETLRYYQSKETVLEDAIEFFQNFDWEKIVNISDQVKVDAKTATDAATSATASKNAAAGSATAAAASQTAAKTSETNAKASETSATSSKNAAAASQTAAKTSETNAKTSETNAKTSETNAKTSETNANNSKTAAAASATQAATSATAASGSATAAKTSETNAKASETAANASKVAAAGSQTAAANSATTATQQADRAKTEADRAATANPDNQLKKANNLSDVANVDTSRNNIKAAGTQVANTFTQKQTFSNTIELGSNYGNPLLISSANPTIKFSESDKPAGSTDYAFVMDGGNWRLQREDNGSPLMNYSYVSNEIRSNVRHVFTHAVSLDSGGTGATNAKDARTNIEIDKFGLGLSDSSGQIANATEGSSTGLANGFYAASGDFVGTPFGIGNGQFLGLLNFNCTQSNAYKFQLAGSYSTGGRLMFRNMNAGNYNAWKEVAVTQQPTFIYGINIGRPDYSQTMYVGVGGADVYIRNTASERVLQLKNNGVLSYNDRVVLNNAGVMKIGLGADTNETNLGAWLRTLRDDGGSQISRVTGAMGVISGATFQYNQTLFMNTGDTFGTLTVDYRNSNVYATANNYAGLNNGVVQVNALWGTKNTTVDANGFIKRASPIVKIMSDRFEVNDESEGVIVERVAIGEYLVSGCLGLHSDLAWGGVDGGFEVPKDRNGQNKIWVDYDMNQDGSILVKTYHREYKDVPVFARNKKEGFEDGQPIDIPADSFLSIRVDMPEESIYNTKMKEVEREVASNANREAWSKAHETGCEEE